MSDIKVLIVDDQGLIRESLGIVLNMEANLTVVGQAKDGQEAVELCESLMPDVVLMDINMPVMDGVSATKLIKEAWPDIKVIILTSYQDVDYVVSALANGAEGYLLKTLHPQSLASSIRLVHSGGTLVTKEMAASLINSNLQKEEEIQTKSQTDQRSNLIRQYGLSERELEVLQLLAQGLRNSDISERLFLSGGTVKNYISNIYAKLEVKGRTAAANKARSEGFL
ncbi:response regulator transcription factor [Bacillus sp. T33-2]|uniref:response regulator transcription factor n=1 Tax=Bacillus sp. T33-2 TaxID=2054168 RepID=UPI000C77B0EF|nr:response regulator transcription factor [Bacillus sp. T33-2]PLR99248.1 DNA-binding response regulator [Bacillus sp. T33-2]